MKRLSVMIVLSLLLFTRCQESNMELDVELQNTVPISFELSFNDTRSDFMSLFPDGKINWGNKNKVEYVYILIPDRHLYYNHEESRTIIIGVLFELKAEVDESVDKLVFKGEIPQNLLWEGRATYLYYFGNNGQGLEGTNVTNIYDDVKPEYLIGKKITFDKQDGSLENIGDYHVAYMATLAKEIKNDIGEIVGYDLTPYYDSFRNMMALALVDLEGETKLGGSATRMKSLTVKWANNKEFVTTLEYNSNATIDVSGNVGEKSLIALLPMDGDVTLECSKGKYRFLGGVRKNQIYVGRNGYTFEHVLPLEWE